MFIVLWIIVGVLAGFLTGKLMKGNRFGSIWDVLTGIAGALIGGFITRALAVSAEGGPMYAVVVATLSAMLLTFAVRWFLDRKNTAA